MPIRWTIEEVRLDLALRALSTLILAFFLFALGPGDLNLADAASLESARVYPLNFEAGLSTLHSMRAFYILDFLFLFSLGYLIRATILSRAHYWRADHPGERLQAWWYLYGPALCLIYILTDLTENLIALGLLADALKDTNGAEGAFQTLRALGHLKFFLVGLSFAAAAAAWRDSTPDPNSRRLRILRRIIWIAFAAAALIAPLLAIQRSLGPGFLLCVAAGFLVQIVWFGAIRYVSRLLFFLRVPVVTKLVMALLPALALSPLRNFLSANLFFATTPSGYLGFFGCTFFCCMLAFSLSAHTGLILERGAIRFEVPELQDKQWFWVRVWFQFSALAACLLTPLAGLAYSYPPSGSSFYFGLFILILGFLAALTLVAFIDIFRAWLSREQIKQSYLILPGRIGRNYRARIMRSTRGRPPAWLDKSLLGLFKILGNLRPVLGPGYFNRFGTLYPDQAFALSFLLAIAGLFIGLVAWGESRQTAPVPTLTSIVMLILFLSSGLGALAFYLDRYRLPLLGGLACFLIAGVILVPNTDHRFAVSHPLAAPYKTPAEILRGRQRPILIAASGGGIQAAAWLTRIVQGLSEERAFELNRRVALFSTVSGGSVGALFLGAEWNSDLRAASKNSRESSMGAVSWSFAGPDLFRPLAAALNLHHWDRGYALEKTLRGRLKDNGATATLDHWAAKAGPDFPAFLINATVSETGGPVAFATTRLPSPTFAEKHPNPITRNHVVPSWQDFTRKACANLTTNVSIPTAARLSASFPYVSPAARPDLEGANCNYHFVDGGYYDNYGIIALLQWLDDALESMDEAQRPAEVGIILIRGSYSQDLPGTTPWSYLSQISAPLESFLHMRDYAQWQGGAAALRLFTDKWEGMPRCVRLNIELLDYPVKPKTDAKNKLPLPCSEEPLSWKLTPTEQGCIDSAFGELQKGGAYNRILDW